LSRRGARPFVTETTTLYCRERFTAEELVHTAAFNGFSSETMGCPFRVADLVPDVTVRVKGRVLHEVGVAGEIAHADAMVVLSHVTGHGWTAGLAGAMKQLGMGCVGRRTKAEVHRATTITVSPELCNACGKCVVVCKSNAIRMTEEAAVLNERCIRCGVCIGSCPHAAIGYSHDYDLFARGLAEAASGASHHFHGGRAVFVNLLIDVTWHCDCEDFSDTPVFPDIGVVVSRDPVAADQASADLLNGAEPVPGSRADDPSIKESGDMLKALTGIDWWMQLDHAAEVGLGTRDYSLKRVKS